MSYNTRRQGGVGRGTSQVMYHQQQAPGQRSSGPVRPSGPSNPPVFSSGYGSQSGGFQSGVSSGYGQQYQAQQQVVPPPPPPPMSVQQPPAPKPLHGILKTESSQSVQQPLTKAPPSPPSGVGEGGDSVDNTTDEGGEEVRSKPPWMKSKKLGFKVNKNLKRRRQNARLRKLLQPKNAIMVLNELVTGVKFNVQEQVNALSQLTYQVTTEIEGKVYTGHGLSKIVAKQNAAENALKRIILERLSKSPMKLDSSQSEKGEENNGAAGGVSDGEEGTANMEVDDDVPWKSLTSFAIYKLFLEWQNEGIPVPSVIPPKSPGPANTEDQQLKPMKKVPDNPTDRHPVMLLNHMRPGLVFVELSRSGNPPDITFTMEVIVDGKSYTGVGKNKKEAKKEAAKAALADALNIHYP